MRNPPALPAIAEQLVSHSSSRRYRGQKPLPPSREIERDPRGNVEGEIRQEEHMPGTVSFVVLDRRGDFVGRVTGAAKQTHRYLSTLQWSANFLLSNLPHDMPTHCEHCKRRHSRTSRPKAPRVPNELQSGISRRVDAARRVVVYEVRAPISGDLLAIIDLPRRLDRGIVHSAAKLAQEYIASRWKRETTSKRRVA